MNNFIKDNRGFMMAELIIVSAIIITTLVALYASFSKMYSTYSERGYYLDVDGKYILKTIYDDLIDNNKFVSLVNGNDGLNESSDVKKRYVNIVKDGNCTISDLMSSGICDILKDNYYVATAIFGRYDEAIFNNINIGEDNTTNTASNLFTEDYSEGFKRYFNYLDGYLDFNDNYSYIFLIEYKIGDNIYYSNYLVR